MRTCSSAITASSANVPPPPPYSVGTDGHSSPIVAGLVPDLAVDVLLLVPALLVRRAVLLEEAAGEFAEGLDVLVAPRGTSGCSHRDTFRRGRLPDGNRPRPEMTTRSAGVPTLPIDSRHGRSRAHAVAQRVVRAAGRHGGGQHPRANRATWIGRAVRSARRPLACVQRAADRRVSDRSRPSSSIDSNSGGDTVLPVIATRIGP